MVSSIYWHRATCLLVHRSRCRLHWHKQLWPTAIGWQGNEVSPLWCIRMGLERSGALAVVYSFAHAALLETKSMCSWAPEWLNPIAQVTIAYQSQFFYFLKKHPWQQFFSECSLGKTEQRQIKESMPFSTHAVMLHYIPVQQHASASIITMSLHYIAACIWTRIIDQCQLNLPAGWL